MIRRLCLPVFAASLLASCNTAPAASSSAPPAPATSETTDTGLPAQRLEPGECGLFLWSMTAPRSFIFFSRAASGDAKLWHEGRALPLQIIDSHGDVFGQFLTASEYLSASDGISVSLSITPGEALEQGQRVSAGRLVTRSQDGWETVQPVTGATACMAR